MVIKVPQNEKISGDKNNGEGKEVSSAKSQERERKRQRKRERGRVI